MDSRINLVACENQPLRDGNQMSNEIEVVYGCSEDTSTCVVIVTENHAWYHAVLDAVKDSRISDRRTLIWADNTETFQSSPQPSLPPSSPPVPAKYPHLCPPSPLRPLPWNRAPSFLSLFECNLVWQSLSGSFPDAPLIIVINLLAAEQASITEKFSRPDLYPESFHDLPCSLTRRVYPFSWTVGSTSCKLETQPLPSHDIKFLEGLGRVGRECASGLGGVTLPELFIWRVERVEETQMVEKDRNGTQPLLYHRRGRTTCAPTKSR